MKFVSYGQVLNTCNEKRKAHRFTNLLSYKQTNYIQKEFIPTLANHLTDLLTHWITDFHQPFVIEQFHLE